MRSHRCSGGNARNGRTFKLQSRNRESYDFNFTRAAKHRGLYQFQSRNRESYDFNRLQAVTATSSVVGFQSRNREAYDFNLKNLKVYSTRQLMFQSRNREAYDFNAKRITGWNVFISFNLAIERLMISIEEAL